MFSFIFAWMGSLIFWLIYAACSIVIGTQVFKLVFPKIFKSVVYENIYITYDCWVEWFFIGILFLFMYTCWPLVLLILILFFTIKYGFTYIIVKPFVKLIIAADKAVPEFEIKRKE